MLSYTGGTLNRDLQSTRAEAGPPPIGLAYLLSVYPAVSHTFFLREVIGLRGLGFEIHTASINRADRAAQDLTAEERLEAAGTYYVKPQGFAARLRAVGRICALAVGHPAVLLRGLGACLTLPSRAVGLPLRLGYLAEAMLLGGWMRRKNLTRLHVHFGGPVSSVALLTGLAWRIPWSITFHGPGEFHAEDECWLRPKLLAARHVFAISEYTRSQLLRIAPESPETKVSVIRLGVRSSLLEQAREASPREGLEIVCTGRLVAAKGQRILLRAFAALGNPSGLRLTMIGDGPDRGHLERLSRELGIAERVDWLGARNHDETLRRVAGAQIFVLASFAEGLPVALMEAMALGVPCISTYIAGIPELISSEQNGLLVPAGSVERLRAAMERLIADASLRERLAGCAKRTVREEYLLESNHQALGAAMREVWGERIGERQG